MLWSDIGGLVEVKQRLKRAVEWPILHREAFVRLGLAAPRGILLHGPPGEPSCGEKKLPSTETSLVMRLFDMLQKIPEHTNTSDLCMVRAA